MIFSTFSIPNMGARPVPRSDGILAIASVVSGEPTIILLVDMQRRNSGVSLTNAIEKAVSFVSADPIFYEAIADIHSVYWVEVDSMGFFDSILPCWSGKECVSVDYCALADGMHKRNRDAFIGKFGVRAKSLLNHSMLKEVFLR